MKGKLTVRLLSDTTFGSGSMAAGEVDDDIERDEEGFPQASARRIEGLLREQWLAMAPYFQDLQTAAVELLGVEGDNTPGAARLLVLDNARLPEAERNWLRYAIHRREHPVDRAVVFRAYTTVRARHARDRRTGAPASGALRKSRMLIRETTLEAAVSLGAGGSALHWQLLELLCAGVRHVGQGRNRGPGNIEMTLEIGQQGAREESRQ
jgi:hypothetical protein